MAASHITALDLLGKQVSFIDKRVLELTDKSFVTLEYRYSGTVTDVLLSLTGNSQISIDDGDLFSLHKLVDFKFL